MDISTATIRSKAVLKTVPVPGRPDVDLIATLDHEGRRWETTTRIIAYSVMPFDQQQQHHKACLSDLALQVVSDLMTE